MRALLLFFISFSVFANESCLDLSGTYQCRDLDGSYVRVTVEQDGNEFYLDGVEPLNRVIADGSTHYVANANDYRNASYAASCSTTALTANGQGEVYQSGWRIGFAKFRLNLSKLTNGSLRISLKGTLRGALGSLPINENRTCRAL